MERFTQRARHVLSLAQDEAEYFKVPTINPEHLLLGMLREEGSVAGRVLRALDLEYESLKNAINAQTPLVSETTGQIDIAAETKKVLEYSVDEARRMGHHYIGTEHLLLGITRLPTGMAAQLMNGLNITPQMVRQTTLQILQTAPQASPANDPISAAAPASASSWRSLGTTLDSITRARQFSFTNIANRVRHYNLQREFDRTPLSEAVLDRLTMAVEEARLMQMQQVEVEHLFLSLLQADSDIWDKLGYHPAEISELRLLLRQSIENRRQQ
jgi:ATP-dependent Clp protease ATP-binding subunit ClpA